MAKKITIQVEGLDKLKKKFGKIPEDIAAEVDAELHAATLDFEDRAAREAPVNLGGLRNGIKSVTVGEMHHEIVSNADYSAYVEFGTRGKVNIPPDLQQMAAQFKGKGAKGDAKKMIYEWCRNKGIPQEIWGWIFVKIMRDGTKAQPFFFKQRGPVWEALMKNLQPAIKRALEA
jgi:HK97 gp10 family phage protein